MPKSHCPTIKAQKTTHVSLLFNYPLSMTSIIQLSPYKYRELINKLSHQKFS